MQLLGHTEGKISTLKQRAEWGIRSQRQIIISTLLSPAILLFCFPFLASLWLLFSNSAYHFNGIKIERLVTFEAYRDFFTDPFYWDVLKRTLSLATIATTVTTTISYPVAYAISRLQSQRLKILFYILIFSPLLTSIVTRAFGWMILLGGNGFINYALVQTGLVNEPVRMIYDVKGVIIAMVHIPVSYTHLTLPTILLV